MKAIVIKQTIEFTSGLFKGKETVRYFTVYNERKRVEVMSGLVRLMGSPYKIVKSEVLK